VVVVGNRNDSSCVAVRSQHREWMVHSDYINFLWTKLVRFVVLILWLLLGTCTDDKKLQELALYDFLRVQIREQPYCRINE
jgi:hypothetical protein